MAAILRVGWRQVRTPWRRTASNIAEHMAAEEAEAVTTTVTWRNISLFVAIPGCLLTAYNAYSKEMAHEQHIKEHGRPEFVPYTHLRLRKKPFPWGDGNHTLIHNPETNPLPDGYEEQL